MNTASRWIIGIIVLIIVVGGAWYLFGRSASAPAMPAAPSAADTTGVVAVPGDNLTLGQDSNAAVGKYLIAYNGMTLYTYAPDTTGVSNCTGGCLSTWPPYTVTSTANLVAESPIAGAVSTLTRDDGSTQVTYNGHPLYFYTGDDAGGDTNGQGVGGVWYVAAP